MGTIALRYHNVYGPRLPRDTPYAGVAALFADRLAAGRARWSSRTGASARDFVHVHDVARANGAALHAVPGGHAVPDEPGLRAYNVASGRPVTVLDVARALAAALGGPTPEVVGGYRLGDVRHIVASPERAACELGFRARVSLEDGAGSIVSVPGG